MFKNVYTLNPIYFRSMEHFQNYSPDIIQQYFQAFTNPSFDFSVAVEITSNKKISIYAVDNDGNTILNYILSLSGEQYNENILLKFIKQIKINDIYKIINIVNNNGLSPLHYICINQYEKIYNYLIDNKIIFNYNIQDNKQKTPLHYLCLGIKQDIKLNNEKERILDFINKLQNKQIELFDNDLTIDIDYDKINYNIIYDDINEIIHIEFFINNNINKDNYLIINVYKNKDEKKDEKEKKDEEKKEYKNIEINNNTLYNYLLHIYRQNKNIDEYYDITDLFKGGDKEEKTELYMNVKYKLFYIFKDFIFNFNFKTENKEIIINNIYSLLNYKFDKDKPFDKFIKEYYEYMIIYNYIKQIKKYKEMYNYYYDNFKNINYVYINNNLLKKIYEKTSLKLNDIFNYSSLFYISRIINNPLKNYEKYEKEKKDKEKNNKILKQLKEYYDYDNLIKQDINKFNENPTPIINLLILYTLKQINIIDEDKIKIISYILKNVFTQNFNIILKLLNDYKDIDLININDNDFYKDILFKLIINPLQELKEYEDFVILKNNIEYTINSKEIIEKIIKYYNDNLFYLIDYMLNKPELYNLNNYKIFSLNNLQNIKNINNKDLEKKIKSINNFKEENGQIKNDKENIYIINNNDIQTINELLGICEEINNINNVNNIIVYLNNVDNDNDIYIEYIILDLKNDNDINKHYIFVKFNNNNIIEKKILFNSNKNILSINNDNKLLSFNLSNNNLNIFNNDFLDNLYNTFSINNIIPYIINDLNLSPNIIFKSIDNVKNELIKNNIFDNQNYNDLIDYLNNYKN